jgi:predicted MPP superfamily phosphohydrolase
MKAGMLFIISAFLMAYGGLHYYIYKKALLVFSSGHWLILTFLGLLVVAPILTEVLTHAGLVSLGVPVGRIGYTWMGLAFLFFSFSILLDGYQLSVKAGGRLLGVDASSFVFSPLCSALAAALLAMVATGYGFFAARQINVERVQISSEKLDGMSEPFRIVQISDLHLSLFSDETHLKRLVETIDSLDPDVVVSTGDLVDMREDHLGRFADILNELNPRFGKFSVTGNHEAYLGLDKGLAATNRAGFTMLSYQGVNVGGMINIVGVDDPAVSYRLKVDGPAEKAVLERYSKGEFTVLLKHQPVVTRASVPSFDLQLSGHTHGGQIFPFNWLTKLAYPAKTGLSQVGRETWLYVSRGTGTWGPPIRFLVPPEVTIFELQPEVPSGS